MGLYSRARQVIKTKSKTYGLLFNGSVPEIRHTAQALTQAQRENLILQLAGRISEYSTSNNDFCIIVLFLGKIIERTEASQETQTQEKTLQSINSVVSKMLADITQLARVYSQSILIVTPSRNSIDPELLVHQLFYTLKRKFNLNTDVSSSILDGRIRYFPKDGDNIKLLLEDLL